MLITALCGILLVPLATNFTTSDFVEGRLHLGKTQIKFGFSLDLHYLCRLKALPRLAAGVSERRGERKVRAAQGAPLLKVEAAGDSWSGEKRITASLAR